MPRFNCSLLKIAVMAALGTVVVLACGPFFGIEALHSRKEVLLAPPAVPFETELKSLVPPPNDKLPVVEAESSDSNEIQRDMIETKELSPAIFARVKEMRQQNSGETARAAGDGLPPAIQLYTAGAVSFLHGQNEAARTYFTNLLALPEADRRSRELWAHFMLGRIAAQQGNQAEAAAQFETVRTLARQGVPDPLGLAVASFGEQARTAWNGNEVATAVKLYAQQASYGSPGAVDSLVTVASRILKDNDLLDKAIQDPLTRRLLFICVNENSSRRFFIDMGPNGGLNSTVDRIAAALARHNLTQVAGAGLLASAAYAQGRFDLAQKLAPFEDTPVSFWVQAKLSLRGGNREAALQFYEKALKRFPVADSSRIRSEIGILRVSRSDYKQALDLFYRAAAQSGSSESPDTDSSEWFGFTDYWGDVAYLAERVLTSEELRNYVDHDLPSIPNAAGKAERSRLCNVLARRLMRAGQYREALRYFDDDKTLDAARQYRDAVNKANSWWHWKLTRAEAWFAAAKLARKSGLDLLGFEREPDYAMWNGSYGDHETPIQPQILKWRQQRQQDQIAPYQTEDERKRVAVSGPAHDVRFQYRLTAVDEAQKSASLLPPRSQAYAAVLCEATRWIIDRHPDQARQIYQQYIHHGAYVPWGRTFGHTCPVPDFAAVSFRNTILHREKHLIRKVRSHPLPMRFGALVAIAILAGGSYFVRKQMKRNPYSR